MTKQVSKIYNKFEVVISFYLQSWKKYWSKWTVRCW